MKSHRGETTCGTHLLYGLGCSVHVFVNIDCSGHPLVACKNREGNGSPTIYQQIMKEGKRNLISAIVKRKTETVSVALCVLSF